MSEKKKKAIIQIDFNSGWIKFILLLFSGGFIYSMIWIGGFYTQVITMKDDVDALKTGRIEDSKSISILLERTKGMPDNINKLQQSFNDLSLSLGKTPNEKK